MLCCQSNGASGRMSDVSWGDNRHESLRFKSFFK
jgi:hypothetical protein